MHTAWFRSPRERKKKGFGGPLGQALLSPLRISLPSVPPFFSRHIYFLLACHTLATFYVKNPHVLHYKLEITTSSHQMETCTAIIINLIQSPLKPHQATISRLSLDRNSHPNHCIRFKKIHRNLLCNDIFYFHQSKRKFC